MLVINPKLNQQIRIRDIDSGTEWGLWFFYQEGGTIALAFDAPQSVKITNNHSGSGRKQEKNGNGNEN